MIKPAKPEGLIDTLRFGAIGLSVILIIIGVILMMPGVQDYVTGDEAEWKIEPVDFSTLTYTPGGNAFLACPPYMCPYADPDMVPPVYSMELEKLRKSLMALADSRPGVRLRNIDMDRQQFDFSVYTTRMTYPDVVTVKLHEILPETSTVAIYSRSPLGDDGNERHRKRVQAWLRLLGPAKPSHPDAG